MKSADHPLCLVVPAFGPIVATLLLAVQPSKAASVNPSTNITTYPDGRPSAKYRLEARDHGPVLRHGDGHCHVKLTGVYRMSVAPGFADAAPLARKLIETAPDRIIWGSDYPHLSFADRVGSVELFNLLGTWAPDDATRRKILVENPQRLFGF